MGGFLPFPAFMFHNREFLDVFADSRVKNEIFIDCPVDQLADVYKRKMTALFSKLMSFSDVRKYMKFTDNQENFGLNNIFFELNGIFLKHQKRKPPTTPVLSMDPIDPRSTAYVKKTNFDESLHKYFTKGPSRYDQNKNVTFQNYYADHKSENPSWKHSFAFAKDAPIRNRLPESSYKLNANDKDRDRVFQIESWIAAQNRTILKTSPLADDFDDRTLLKFAKTTMQEKGLSEKHLFNPMDPLVYRSLAACFAHNLGALMYLFEVLGVDFRRKGQTAEVFQDFLTKMKQLFTQNSQTCDYVVQKTVNIFERNTGGWPKTGKPGPYMDLIARNKLNMPNCHNKFPK